MSYQTPCRENQNKQSTDKSCPQLQSLTRGKFIVDRPKTGLKGVSSQDVPFVLLFSPILFSR